jgi:ornithine cyclodeaminase/alanine dehydrogenase-like protein (mu-crystallin family)
LLILNNEEIESLLTVELSLQILEKAYKEWSEGRAINRPRTDLYLPGSVASGVYVFKSMEAGLLNPPVAALRLNSDVIHWQEKGDLTIKQKIPSAPGGKWVGLVLLFSAATGEPLAIFPDGVMQRVRVAGTSALAARHLAREDAQVLGIFGSGWQAGAHVPAMCAVRNIRKIRVYSPTKEHRETFVEEMEKKLRLHVEAMDRPEEVAADADILVAATNATTRVVRPEWIRSGMHFTCVKDCELGEETIRRADRLIIHRGKFAPENYIAGLGDEKVEAHDPLEFLKKRVGGPPPSRPKAPFWAGSPELKDLIARKIPGRSSADETTCFINNIGIGLQFAALGAAVYSEAKAKGMGRKIPTDWFLESVHP